MFGLLRGLRDRHTLVLDNASADWPVSCTLRVQLSVDVCVHGGAQN